MLSVIIGLLSGLVVGFLYFKVLEWSVKKMLHSSKPWLLVGFSFVVRLAFVVLFFVVMAKEFGILGVLSSLVGLMLTRYIFKFNPVDSRNPVQ